MKTRWSFVAKLFIAFVGFRSEIVLAQSDPLEQHIGRETRNIFAVKCAGCHGADAEKPKGRFGYVLDLKRIPAR